MVSSGERASQWHSAFAVPSRSDCFLCLNPLGRLLRRQKDCPAWPEPSAASRRV